MKTIAKLLIFPVIAILLAVSPQAFAEDGIEKAGKNFLYAGAISAVIALIQLNGDDCKNSNYCSGHTLLYISGGSILVGGILLGSANSSNANSENKGYMDGVSFGSTDSGNISIQKKWEF